MDLAVFSLLSGSLALFLLGLAWIFAVLVALAVLFGFWDHSGRGEHDHLSSQQLGFLEQCLGLRVWS